MKESTETEFITQNSLWEHRLNTYCASGIRGLTNTVSVPPHR